MRPLLSRWMMIYLRHMRIKDVSDDSMLAYLMKGLLRVMTPSQKSLTIYQTNT